MQQQADSVEGWLKLALRWKRLAELAQSDPITRNAAWANAGFVVECVLKAAIMSHERLNSWPDRRTRKELYDHDLQKLAAILGMQITVTDPVAPAWAVVISWQRDHMYVADEMPEPVVTGLMDAAFSDDGVVRWISRNYLRNYTAPDGSISVS